MSAPFQRVVEDHKDMVYSFAYYYLGNREEAEDITQEVFLRLWRHWRKIEIDSVPRWLNRVTRNACFDELRRRRSQRSVVTDQEVSAEEAMASSRSPEAVAESSEFLQRLRRTLAQLPEPYRSALVLREINQLKYTEISRCLAVPLNTSKTYVYRGRRMLRERLREIANDPTTNRRTCVR